MSFSVFQNCCGISVNHDRCRSLDRRVWVLRIRHTGMSENVYFLRKRVTTGITDMHLDFFTRVR